jgi:hypothetical protein
MGLLRVPRSEIRALALPRSLAMVPRPCAGDRRAREINARIAEPD